VFVWTDAGDDLGVGMLNRVENPASSGNRPDRKYSLWPIIKYRPNMGLSPEKLSNVKVTRTEQIPPCAARLHLELGHSLRMPLMADDPFYALTEIFAVAAASQNLLLNMIEHKLAQYTQRGSKDFDTLPNLTYLKGVLLRQLSQTKQARHSIRNTEGSKWPRSTASAAIRARKMVEQDYDHIYEHAHELDRRCQEAITVLMSSVTIDDAKKAIAQTERVAKLTILAFVFVPLSFTTSFFGMNFRELEDLSISRWVAMTVPILLATLVVLLINVVRRWDLFVDKIVRTLR
jgi:flagellar biosynthesis/type III secretory pathway chaperone